MGISEVGIELENYEIFNKLSNGEPLIIVQFLRNLAKVDEQRLKKAVVFTYSQVLQPSFNFQNFIEEIFPFLSKKSPNYQKVLRKVVLFFGYNEETNPEDEVENRRIITEKFEKFVYQSNGRFAQEDAVDEPTASPSSSLKSGDNNGSEASKSFPVQLYLSKSIFEEFYERYASCYAIFNWSQFQLFGKLFVDYYPSEIISDFLFLGDYYSGNKKERLAALQITHIIDASNANLSEEAAKEAGAEYLAIKIWDDDNVNIVEHFPTVIDFIERAKETHPSPHILIHCRAGISRSTTFVLAYLMKNLKMTLKDALIHVVTQRPVILPNDGFRKQLYDYEIELFGQSSVQSLEECLDLIHKHSRLFSSASTLENAFDRIPIRASQKRLPEWMKQEYPEENEGSGLGSGNENHKPEDENTAMKTESVKPKKPFLKRGEGKNVHQEFVKQKKLEIERRKKELREKKNLQSQLSSLSAKNSTSSSEVEEVRETSHEGEVESNTEK